VEVNSISFVPIIPVATSSSCWEGMLYLDVTISNDKLSSINEEEMHVEFLLLRTCICTWLMIIYLLGICLVLAFIKIVDKKVGFSS
jgi:hypothetical protein